jgi:hypothetical protein
MRFFDEAFLPNGHQPIAFVFGYYTFIFRMNMKNSNSLARIWADSTFIFMAGYEIHR